MQLTSPFFLFLFFPLSLPLLPLCPRRYRKLALALLSSLWYVFANRAHPLSLLQILGVVLFVCLLSALPTRAPRVRCTIGVAVPLAFLLAARLLAEYAPIAYTYPTGLALVVLGAVSIAIDRYRSDAPEREGPLGVVAYLLFFPTMLVGPILRYKQFLYITDHICPDREHFSIGAQLFMLGFIKRMGIAALLLRTLSDMLSLSQGRLPLLAFALLLAISYALLYSFISGTTDMARGLMSIYGLRPPRAQGGAVPLLFPHRMLYGLHLSLDRYLEDYLVRPLERIFPGRPGKLLSAALVFVLTVCFYRTRPELLLLATPILVLALITANRNHWRRFPRHFAIRIPLSLLSLLCLSVFSLGLFLDDPLDVVVLLRSSLQGHDLYSYYHIFSSVSDTHYLVIATVFFLLIPVSRRLPSLLHHLPPKLTFTLRILASLALCGGFALTILYFLPQFPSHDPTYGAFL